MADNRRPGRVSIGIQAKFAQEAPDDLDVTSRLVVIFLPLFAGILVLDAPERSLVHAHAAVSVSKAWYNNSLS